MIIKPNLEQTVQFLADAAQQGVVIKLWATEASQLTQATTEEELGTFIYFDPADGQTNPKGLYVITQDSNYSDNKVFKYLGEFPKKGDQGIQGERGEGAQVEINNNTETWVINGVDTGRPSRGPQGPRGSVGMQGVPGVGINAITDFIGETPSVTEGEDYDTCEASAKIKFVEGSEIAETDPFDFTYLVPHTHLKANEIPLDADPDTNVEAVLDRIETEISELPTPNNATITITQGGVEKGSFTLNQSGDATIALAAGGGGGGGTSVDGLSGGTITSSTTIKADARKDYALTVQSNADDNGGDYEGGSYIGFRKKGGNVLGYLGIDRDTDAVLNKGGKDYKLGFPISDYIRSRRMFIGQDPVKLPFGSIAFTMSHNLTIRWKEWDNNNQRWINQSASPSGPCVMFSTKIGNSGYKNLYGYASGLIGYVTSGLDLYNTRNFLTGEDDNIDGRFEIEGTGILFYISAEDLGTDP